ncbi:MAG: Fe-S cluster assembly protein SufD [Alphaproteobacteria bacterium]|nr:Fe-S cluster assembly protein SufD [Alphaproteobacteria bacterium]
MFAKPVYIPDESVAAKPSAVAWLDARREKAVAAFPGFPSQNVEQWKYTNVKPLLAVVAEGRPNQGDISTAAGLLDALPAGPRVVFVNGHYHTALSDVPAISGLSVEPLSKSLDGLEPYLGVLSAADEKNGFVSASLAQAEDGFVIRADADAEVSLPIVIAHIHTGGAQAERTFTRSIIVLGESAKLEVIELAVGVPEAQYAAIGTTEIFIADHAELRHTLIQQDSAKGAEVLTRYLTQGKESQYHGLVFTTGAKVNRVETHALLTGEKAHTGVHTVQLLRDERHSDSTTRVTHDTTEATSQQHCRMILDDNARGVFQGKTIVSRDAQKTDGQQLNKNLLLSRTAWVNTKPELEIYADDVKCSHGATTGELDAHSLFYLESRGIDKASARRLLVEAFAEDAITEAGVSEEIKDHLRARVADWMHHG